MMGSNGHTRYSSQRRLDVPVYLLGGKVKLRKFLNTAMSAAALGIAGVASASITIMDQIGPDNLGQQNQGIYASQQFEAAFTAYNIGALDDFVMPSGVDHISQVEIVLGFWNNANPSPLNITNYRVEIYSSVAAGAGNLVGDVAHVVVAPGSVGLVDPWIPGFIVAKASIPVNIPAPAPGTYYIAVVPVMDFGTAGQTGPTSSVWAGNNPGGANGWQVNPGGAFGMPGNMQAANVDFAYRILGEAPAGINVSGTVDLQDLDGDEAGLEAVIEVRNVGSVTPLETHTVTLGAGGSYSFVSNVAAGTYDVAAKGSNWLRQVDGSVSFPNGGATANFSLTNGDADPDNEVNLVDGGAISAAFGSVDGDPNWNENADLNKDGEVNLVDWGIFSAKFGQAGDD